MNEEEKKVVEHLKETSKDRMIIPLDDEILIAVNLIEKLQKENEELNGIYQLAFKDGKESYIRKVKDRIEKYKKLSDKFYVKFLESDRYNTDIREKGIKCDAIILALEELIEEREEKSE